LPCATGKFQGAAALLPRKVDIKRHVRVGRQQRVVKVWMIVEIRNQGGVHS
jgi:hypothetical protein